MGELEWYIFHDSRKDIVSWSIRAGLCFKSCTNSLIIQHCYYSEKKKNTTCERIVKLLTFVLNTLALSANFRNYQKELDFFFNVETDDDVYYITY